MAQDNKKKEVNSKEVNALSASTKKPSRNILKIVMIVLVLLMLCATGFAVGVYLKFIDLQGIAERWKLYDVPVVGQYFSKPQMNFEPVPIDDQTSTQITPPVIQNSGQAPLAANAQTVNPMPTVIDPEKEKLDKAKRQEDNKRIARLARLYGTMKPEEAVAVLNQLNDNDVIAILNKMEEEQVSKILSRMDANRVARLTELILRGQVTRN